MMDLEGRLISIPVQVAGCLSNVIQMVPRSLHAQHEVTDGC